MGIVFSARSFGIPVVISFTVETDGMLPSGERLKDAVETIDNETGGYPSYYMINCAHPSHFQELFSCDESWKNRIRGIRANASCKSHAELDESEVLDAGDKVELALHYRNLRESLPQLSVLGGCCGTDHTHMDEICTFWDSNTLKEEESAGTEAKVERLGM
jgi:S-methylmethionine-dependent homocysteine/selenocysteine methylase